MKNVILLISIILVLFINRLIAQDKYIGFNIWNYTSGLFSKDFNNPFSENFGVGINAEYIPKKAMFSYTAGLQYLNTEKIFMIPIYLNFIPGNKFKLRISGGLMPTVRIKIKNTQKMFGIGRNAGFGFDVKINLKYILCCNAGIYCVSTRYYQPNHFGSTYVEMDMYNIEYLSIGLNYLIETNDE